MTVNPVLNLRHFKFYLGLQNFFLLCLSPDWCELMVEMTAHFHNEGEGHNHLGVSIQHLYALLYVSSVCLIQFVQDVLALQQNGAC